MSEEGKTGGGTEWLIGIGDLMRFVVYWLKHFLANRPVGAGKYDEPVCVDRRHLDEGIPPAEVRQGLRRYTRGDELYREKMEADADGLREVLHQPRITLRKRGTPRRNHVYGSPRRPARSAKWYPLHTRTFEVSTQCAELRPRVCQRIRRHTPEELYAHRYGQGDAEKYTASRPQERAGILRTVWGHGRHKSTNSSMGERPPEGETSV